MSSMMTCGPLGTALLAAGSIALGIATAVPVSASPASAELVADLRDDPYPLESAPYRLTELAPGLSVFIGYRPTTGSELWRTDGTDAGTVLVRDIVPGPPSSWIDRFFVINGLAYFTATTPQHGTELWRTDGTASGTFMVTEIWPGPGDGYPTRFMRLNDLLVFNACSGFVACDLWRSDGTAAGTMLIMSGVYVSATNVEPAIGAQVGGKLIFGASGPGSYESELWETDGTEAGTRLLKDLFPGTNSWGGPGSSSPADFAVVDGVAYFRAGDERGYELWKSDGSAAGTVLVRDIASGMSPWGQPYDGWPRNLTRAGSKLYFSASDGLQEWFWESDGTESGTVPVGDADGALRSCGSPPYLRPYPVLGTRVFFQGSKEASGCELWMTDGTVTGTAQVADVAPGPDSSWPDEITASGGRVFFVAYDPVHGREPRATDGSVTGTTLLKDITASTDPWSSWRTASRFSPHGGGILFMADDGTTGNELWRSDGTPGGTSLVKDIWAPTAPSTPRQLVTLNGRLYFQATNAAGKQVLYRSDGTAAGTLALREFVGIDSLVATDTALFFAGFEAIDQGSDLWTSDGSATGTVKVKSFDGPNSGPGREIVAYKGAVYFEGRDGEGAGLWRSDGTDAGTRRIAAFISVRQLTVAGDTLFFVGEDAVAGVELWKTDGTSEGTRLVKDIDPAIWWGDYPASSYPRQLAALGNQLLFYAYAPDVGIELWRSDGTEAGTRLVRAIAPPWGTSLLPEDSDDLYGSGRPIFTVFRGRAYFVACDLEAGCEPWSTDGTYDGTRRLKDILPGPSSSAYSYNSRFIYPPYSGPRFGVSRDRLFFGAFSGGTGFELWTSDGTEAGTQRLKELVPGKGYEASVFDSFTDFAGAIHFLGCTFRNDWLRDCVLWKSDGTSAGTEPALVDPLFLSHQLYFTGQNRMLVSGGSLYFPAEDDEHGLELFRIASVADPVQLLSALYRTVAGVPPGSSLSGKLAQAQAWVEKGNLRAACGVVRAFSNEVAAQRGKKIDSILAGALVTDAQALMTALGCE